MHTWTGAYCKLRKMQEAGATLQDVESAAAVMLDELLGEDGEDDDDE